MVSAGYDVRVDESAAIQAYVPQGLRDGSASDDDAGPERQVDPTTRWAACLAK